MEQAERIKKMESLFDKSGKIIEQLEQAIDNFSSLQPAIGELEAYYSSDWRTDFEAEEAGELPAGLKCGVLSEDGLWNLLEDYQRLKKLMEEGETD